MPIPNLKAPSSSDEAQLKRNVEDRISDNKKSSTLILILTGTIICLLLIIISLLVLSPSSPSHSEKTEQNKQKIEILKKQENVEVDIEAEVSSQQVEQDKIIEKEEIIINKEIQSKLDDNDDSSEQEKTLKIKQETLDKEFNNRISNTLSALEKNKLGQAEKELEYAAALKPNEPIISDLKQRINLKIKKINIEKLIKKGQIAEKKEQWKYALNLYEKILKIDADINNILVKKQRSITYIKLNDTLNKITNNPERLQNDKVLENSKKLLQFVKIEIKEKKAVLYPIAKTPLLTLKMVTAEKVIKDASVLVNVTIQSDNLTDIAVYKIGQFGKLMEKKLTLRPGNYTIVGSREGYRDIRKNVKISASDHSKVIIVECRETI